MECSYGTCVADNLSSSSSYREKSKSDAELEKMRTKYHNYCPKSKSNNIISCPKDVIKKTNNLKVKWLNEYFKKIAKKSKKKKTKNKKIAKKSKKKKTKKKQRKNKRRNKKRKSRKRKKGKKGEPRGN